MKTRCCDSPIGKIYVTEADGAVVSIDFTPPTRCEVGDGSPLLEQVCGLLDEYFRGGQPDFSLVPLRAEGTLFQQEVWKALLTIPYGETRTYGDWPSESRACCGWSLRTKSIADTGALSSGCGC